MKGNTGSNMNTPTVTSAEDKTLISAWDFLPRPIIETLAKAGVIHLNDFILLDRLSIWPLPLSDNEKGIVLQQRDLLLANYDKSFVPFPFLFGDCVTSYSTLFSLMTIQQRLKLKEQNGGATVADRISSATIDVIFSMFHSASFYAEKSVFTTPARPSVEMAKENGMIRLWDAGLDDIAAFSNALADKDIRTVFDMVHAIFVGYRLSLDSLKVPVVETWYHYFPEPFMHNLYAVSENPDDAQVREKAEHDVRTHIIDLKSYQFALRIRELDIYSHTPLPFFADKPIYNKVQLNFVKALKDFDRKHPNSIRAFGVAIEDVKTGKTDAPTAFQDKNGIDFTDFVRESLTMPMYVSFEHPIPHLAGTGYDGINAKEPSPWHHALRERFLETLRGYFRNRAKNARKGGTIRRLWLNAEAELLAYMSEYFNHADDAEEFKAPQKVIDAANAAAREEWIARNDEDCENAAVAVTPRASPTADDGFVGNIITGVKLKDGKYVPLSAEELQVPYVQPSIHKINDVVAAIGIVEDKKPDEEALREAASAGLPEILRHIDESVIKKLDELDLNAEKRHEETISIVEANTKAATNLGRKVDAAKSGVKTVTTGLATIFPKLGACTEEEAGKAFGLIPRYGGLDKIPNTVHRSQIKAAIDYSHKEGVAVHMPKQNGTTKHPTVTDLAEKVWELNQENWQLVPDSFKTLTDYTSALLSHFKKYPDSLLHAD